MDIVIVGGMAAGCKAAARLKRLRPDWKIKLIEKKDFISYGTCGMPLFASGELQDFYDLAKTSQGVIRDDKFFADVKGVDVLINTKVNEIFRNRKTIRCETANRQFELPYDKLILATGARTRYPKIKMPNSHKISSFHNPASAIPFRQLAQSGKISKLLIIGGGYIGVELAEAAATLWGIDTTIIEAENRLLPRSADKDMSLFMENVLKENGVEIILSDAVKEVREINDSLEITTARNTTISADYLFICTGTAPNADLADSCGLEIGMHGGISVDEHLHTSDPDIFAAGDCVEVYSFASREPTLMALGSLANRMGRVAADAIAGIDSRFAGASGAVSVKVFDTIFCSVGINYSQAQKLGIDAGFVTGSFNDRPDYHPDREALKAKLIYDKKDGRIVGFQAVSKGEVTRYADTVSMLIAAGADYNELCILEHAYNPPHSSPLSPLNFMGFMIEDAEKDGIKGFAINEVNLAEHTVIDVRSAAECESKPNGISTSINIPLDELRGKLTTIKSHVPVFCICERGTRSYEAARILKNGGFHASYLSGGLKFLSGKL